MSSPNMANSQPSLGGAVDRLNATALRAGDIANALRDQLRRLGVYAGSNLVSESPGRPTSPVSQIAEIHNSLDGLTARLRDMEEMATALERTLARESEARCVPDEPTPARRY